MNVYATAQTISLTKMVILHVLILGLGVQLIGGSCMAVRLIYTQ